MCECLQNSDGTWHVDECCAWVMDQFHRDGFLATEQQSDPTPGKKTVIDLVSKDLRIRAEAGRRKYGAYLETHNGRDALVDAYQEALDLAMYLRQAIGEREGPG